MSIDGISSVGPGSNTGVGGASAIGELFRSFNAIEEIHIGETINSAKFGGVADITTISKSGSNSLHGGVFENLPNNDMNAADFFSHVAPELKMNNFGISWEVPWYCRSYTTGGTRLSSSAALSVAVTQVGL
jgi:hypothetical protein